MAFALPFEVEVNEPFESAHHSLRQSHAHRAMRVEVSSQANLGPYKIFNTVPTDLHLPSP